MARAAVFDDADLAAAGLAVARRDGWAAVTMRSVADELGVSPMALYRLAPDADHLRRSLADAAAPPVEPGPEPVRGRGPGDPRSLPAVLREWALGAYGHLGRHPGLAAYLIGEWTELPAWLDVVEALLARAEASGLSGPDAVAAVNAVFAYVLVRAQLHDAATAAPRRALRPLRDHPDRYPLVTRDRPEFARARTTRHFLYGLDTLVRGLSVTFDHDS